MLSNMSDTPEVPTPANPAAQPAVPAEAAPAPAPAAPFTLGAPAAQAVLPVENKTRGTLLALIALPAGIIVWNIVWAIGFISGWVSLGVALVALFLYRRGSGGRIGYDGAVRLSILTVVTLGAAFFIGLIVDRVTYGGPVQYTNLGLNVVLLVVFAIIGIVIIFRTANTTLKQQAVAEAGTTKPPAV